MYEIVVALSKNLGIGKNNKLPWNIKEDLKHFKELTVNNIVVMGRKTYFSLPEKNRPLPNRINIIITNNPNDYKNTENIIFTNLENFYKCIQNVKKKIFIIGGQEIYKLFINETTKMHLTYIDKNYDCDVKFPSFKNFEIKNYSENYYSENENCNYRFITLIKNDNIQNELPYLELVKDIIRKGHERLDRTGVGTKGLFGKQIRFDISKNIPILTSKYISWKSVIKELLWFLKGSTNANELNKEGVKIWNGNTTRDFLDKRGLDNYQIGDIGPMYFFQIYHFNAEYYGFNHNYENQGFNQMEILYNGLKNDPFSRRHLLTTYNPIAIEKSVLAPCHGIVIQFYVEEYNNEKYLSCHMYQRSVDVFLGLPFNILSYAVLTHIIAFQLDMIPKELIISTGDTHIYKNHIEQIKKQLGNDLYAFPILKLNNCIKTKKLSQINIEDFDIIGYFSNEKIKGEMAI